MSRASLRRKGPRSGLSSDESGRAGLGTELGDSGGGFRGENLEREGEGEGGFLGRGEAGLGGVGSDLGVWSGREMRGGGASGGVLTETRPGMAAAAAGFLVLDRGI